MEKEEAIKKEAGELLKKLGLQFTLEVSKTEETYLVQINSEEDAPYLIGKYGETLEAVKIILEAMLFKIFNEPVDISVNVNDYLEKQKERLWAIASDEAAKVKRENQKVSIRSVSAYERKIVHEFIAENHPELTSYSEGEGADRILIIAPKDK